MKSLKVLFSAFAIFSFCACSNGDNKQESNGSKSVDYSSCPYIGTGSHYVITAGSGSTYQTMHFFFDPDGEGAWAYTKIVDGQDVYKIYEFVFILTGEVNVTWLEKESKETGKGYFTTDSTGQVFVCEGLHFYRYS